MPQQHLSASRKASFLVGILANEWSRVRTVAAPVGKDGVCVCERKEMCGRNQGKIITVNWPETLFPLPLAQSQDPHKTPAERSC